MSMDEIKIKLEEIEDNLKSIINIFNIGPHKKYDIVRDIYGLFQDCNDLFNININLTMELRREIYIFNELYHFVNYNDLLIQNEMQNESGNYNITYYKNKYIDPLIKLIKNVTKELDEYKKNQIIPFIIQYAVNSIGFPRVSIYFGNVNYNELENTLNRTISNIMVENCDILINNYLEYEDEIYSRHFMEQPAIIVKYFYNNKWYDYNLLNNKELMKQYKIVYDKTYLIYNYI